MILPGAAYVVRADTAGWDAASSREAAAAAARGEAAARVEAQARDAIAQAWRDRTVERLRTRRTASFAAEFRIPFDLAHEIHLAALDERIPPTLAFGLVRAESSFRPTAVSPVGALGLTQLMPSTARWLEPGMTRREMLDPATNLRVGFRYLRQLMETYSGDERLALTAYNRGPGTVDRALRRGHDPRNGYAELVMTGKSDRHVALMRKKFGRRRRAE